MLSGFIITFIHAGDIGHPARLASFARKRPSQDLSELLDRDPGAPGHHARFSHARPARARPGPLSCPACCSCRLRAEPLLGPGWSLRHELLFYGLFGLGLLNRKAGARTCSACGSRRLPQTSAFWRPPAIRWLAGLQAPGCSLLSIWSFLPGSAWHAFCSLARRPVR